jgi:hypothetical protein
MTGPRDLRELAQDETSAQAEALRLKGSARRHKRRAGLERQLAKEAMRRLAELESICSEYGITLVLENQ